jgi:hypothetical protein
MKDTLDTKINVDVTDDRNDVAVKTYLNLIAANESEKTVQRAEDEAIELLLESNFEVSDPTGAHKLNSQKLYQALWRTEAKMKPHDFMIHGTGRKEWQEQLVTAATATVMDRGGYDSALRDKNGAFYDLLVVGDGLIMIGSNPNKKSISPIQFTPFSRSHLYLDNFSSGIRNRGKAGSAFRAVVVFSYSWEQACDMYPELKEKGGVGKIPKCEADWNSDRTDSQNIRLEDETEIAFGYNIIDGRANFTIFAGSSCTILEQYGDEDYPYEIEGNKYIPIIQMICVPKKKGAFNYGIGHLLYKLAIVSSRLLNMELGHAEDNVYPITLINTAQGEAANLFQKLALAEKMRAAGKKPFVALEHDPNNPQTGAVSAQSLITQNLYQEWQLIYQTLLDEIQMLGINIKELIGGGKPTATELLLDEKNSDAWIGNVGEYNASEAQFAAEVTMDMMKTLVSENSKIPLDLTTEIKFEGEEMRMDNVTMGMVVKELKENHYFVRVDSKSGKIPSDTMLKAKMMTVFPYLQPGSKAFAEAAQKFMGVNDLDFSVEAQQAPQPTGQPTGQPVAQQPALV